MFRIKYTVYVCMNIQAQDHQVEWRAQGALCEKGRGWNTFWNGKQSHVYHRPVAKGVMQNSAFCTPSGALKNNPTLLKDPSFHFKKVHFFVNSLLFHHWKGPLFQNGPLLHATQVKFWLRAHVYMYIFMHIAPSFLPNFNPAHSHYTLAYATYYQSVTPATLQNSDFVLL